MMTQNPILDEVYAIRERLLADAGGDLEKFLADVRDREAASGRLLGQGEVREAGPSLTDPRRAFMTRAAEPPR
jgi:hypothetical protein